MAMMHEDRISKLPDDILISIISRLTIREATSTCILSTCWGHLHTYVNQLNFSKTYVHESNRLSNYGSIVDHVLNSHRGSRIKEFSLYMIGEGNFESSFKFALTKRAEIIHIAIYGNKDLDLDFLRLPNMNNGLQCIKDLSLCGLKLTDQDFELLVSNCLALESLTVESSYELKNVSIVGLSKLKRLNLSYFVEVESIVIRDAISLVSLTLHQLSSGCTVQLSNTPKLTKLNFRERSGQVLLAEFLDGMPSGIRDQLQVMHLSTDVDFYMHKIDLDFHDELFWIDLVNIKHLELEIDKMGFCRSLYMLRHFCRLVETCSCLNKLVIKFPYMLSSHNEDLLEIYVGRCKFSLKYLEITGYLGAPIQLALALYVINNARSLEKVTVVACDKDALARARHDFRHIRSVSLLVTI